jgi:hypothetical protein
VYYENKNYAREFYDKFKDVLMGRSPEYWQQLLYDVLKQVCNKRKNLTDLRITLLDLLQSDEAVNYLVSFRKELVMCLHKAKFL